MKDVLRWFITTKTQLLMSHLKNMALSLSLIKITRVKMFKVSRGLIPEFISEIFRFHIPSIHSVLLVQKAFNYLDRRHEHWCLMK